MGDFAVVIIQPPDYIHSLAFEEMGRLLTSSIQSLGHQCELVRNRFFEGRLNIILGYNLLSIEDARALRAYDCAIYQLEQLSDREGWFSNQSLQVLEAVKYVWDYSPENIRYLAGFGLTRVRYLPIGYHPDLQRIKAAKEQDIDVLFFGSLNDRRNRILNQLKQDCRIEALFGVYGERRDPYIARAKIVLNIHYYEAQILEQVRISYLLNNGCFVVSETSKVDPYDKAVVMVDYRDLADTCRRYLNNPGERLAIARAGLQSFMTNEMKTNIGQVLAEDGLV